MGRIQTRYRAELDQGSPPTFQLGASIRNEIRKVYRGPWSTVRAQWRFPLISEEKSLFQVVQEYERAVIFRLGRLIGGGARGPGIFFVLPCIETYTKVDLRTVSFNVPPQEILTKDSVTTSVDAVVYYRVSNATISVANVENAHHSTRFASYSIHYRNSSGYLPRRLSETCWEPEVWLRFFPTGTLWPAQCKPYWMRQQKAGESK